MIILTLPTLNQYKIKIITVPIRNVQCNQQEMKQPAKSDTRLNVDLAMLMILRKKPA